MDPGNNPKGVPDSDITSSTNHKTLATVYDDIDVSYQGNVDKYGPKIEGGKRHVTSTKEILSMYQFIVICLPKNTELI